MGLDLHIKNYYSDNSKIGSYTGFNLFREGWAKHLGFNLREMVGFDGEKEWTNEPMQFFFNHSDCDGELSVEECKTLLKQIKKDRKDLSDFEVQFEVLVEHCKVAIKNNEPITFG